MKIYHSSVYVDLQKETKTFLQLKVINIWDFKSIKHCYKNISGTIVFYSVNEYSKKEGDTFYSSKEVKVITENIKNELLKMGYTPLLK